MGKRGILTRKQFGATRPDCEYYAFDLGEEALGDSSLLPGIFRDLLAAFAKGELRPLPLTTFSSERIVDAFRFMARAKHIGKIIVTKPALDADARISRTKFGLRDNATYLITGGLGGIGLIIARWLVNRGARHLILAGRSSLLARELWDGVAPQTTEGVRITAIRVWRASVRMSERWPWTWATKSL